MRKTFYAVSLCATTLVLMAGRCSDDDDKKSEPAAAPSSKSGEVTPDNAMDAVGYPDEKPGDSAGKADTGGGAAKDNDKDKNGKADPNAKDPDDVFKDPLDQADASSAPGATQAPDDSFLDDPNIEPEAPPADLPAADSGATDI